MTDVVVGGVAVADVDVVTDVAVTKTVVDVAIGGMVLM